MNLPLTIAYRYLRRPTDALVSAVGMVSILGLVIGVMALVISMALMTGYRRDLQRKLLGGNAEVFVYSVGAPISDTPRLLQIVRSTPGVAEASPVLFQHALVATERRIAGRRDTRDRCAHRTSLRRQRLARYEPAALLHAGDSAARAFRRDRADRVCLHVQYRLHADHDRA